MVQCKKVPVFPTWIKSSETYRKLFNDTAKEMGLRIAYIHDAVAGVANLPELKMGEVEVDAAQWKKYGISEQHPKSSKLLDQDICTIRGEIEHRRKVMNDAGMHVFPMEKSGTHSQGHDSLLNAAEKVWFQRVGDTLYDASMVIYGMQAAPHHLETLKWEHHYADVASRFHYERVRSPYGAPKKEVPSINDSIRYASSIPWFPDAPSFSNMWPTDFSADELSYVNKTYADQDPIRLPWTRVARISADEAAKINASPQRYNGNDIEWARKGEGDRWYRVVNMTFDEEMRPQFLRMAKVLRDNANVSVAGSQLDPQFRQFTLTMAECLEKGDFQRLLAEDLKQASGSLFMSFFPHEGYWDDGVKYPVMFEVGVVDTSALELLKKQSYVFNWMAKEVERVAKGSGFPQYVAPKFDVDNIRRNAILLWPLRLGGFARAFQRDPGGHDYPKRSYPGISEHRVVAILDTLFSWNNTVTNLAGKLLSENTRISKPRLVETTLYHEAGHSAQVPQNQQLPNGKTLSDALGMYWGALVEPWADVCGAMAMSRLRDDNVIAVSDYKDSVMSDIIYNAVRLYPRSDALSEDLVKEAPHITGSSMYLGWYYREGAIQWKNKRLVIDFQKFDLATRSFFDALVRQAVAGDQGAFKKFVKDCVESLPEDVEKQIIANKETIASYVLIDRGEFGRK